MALSETNRSRVQALYTAIATQLRARYGEGMIVEHVRLVTGTNGVVTDLVVDINTQTPPDADGDTTRVRKAVSIW